jgi:hypothetical protein
VTAFVLAREDLRLLVLGPKGATAWDLGKQNVIAEPIRSVVSSGDLDERNGIFYEVSPQGSQQLAVEAISVADGASLRRFAVDVPAPVLDLTVSNDGQRMLVTTGPLVRMGGEAGMASLRFLVVSTSDGAVEREITTEQVPYGDGLVGGLAWSSDQRRAAYLGLPTADPFSDGWLAKMLVIVDLESGSSTTVDLGANASYFSESVAYILGWSAAGEVVVGDYYGRRVTFVDPVTGEGTPLRLRSEASSYFGIIDIDTAPDGALVLTSDAGEVWLVDPVSRDPLGDPLNSDGVALASAAVSPDGAIVAALDFNGMLLLWDRATGRPLSSGIRAVDADWSALYLYFVADGTLVTATLSPTSDGYVLLRWRLDTASLVAKACQLAGRELTEEEWRTFVDPESTPEAVCSTP